MSTLIHDKIIDTKFYSEPLDHRFSLYACTPTTQQPLSDHDRASGFLRSTRCRKCEREPLRGSSRNSPFQAETSVRGGRTSARIFCKFLEVLYEDILKAVRSPPSIGGWCRLRGLKSKRQLLLVEGPEVHGKFLLHRAREINNACQQYQCWRYAWCFSPMR